MESQERPLDQAFSFLIGSTRSYVCTAVFMMSGSPGAANARRGAFAREGEALDW